MNNLGREPRGGEVEGFDVLGDVERGGWRGLLDCKDFEGAEVMGEVEGALWRVDTEFECGIFGAELTVDEFSGLPEEAERFFGVDGGFRLVVACLELVIVGEWVVVGWVDPVDGFGAEGVEGIGGFLWGFEFDLG